ncbi:hypothetical protein D9M70_442230 [compost metagenome]
MTVRGRTDADGEDAGVAAVFLDLVEELRLIADRAIGQEDHLAKRAGLNWTLRAQCSFQRGQHFRAAVGGETADIGDRILALVRCRLGELRKMHRHRVVEADDVEAVFGLQPGDRQRQALLRLFHRGAGHGTGIVDDKDDLAFDRLGIGLACGSRWRDEGEQVGLVPDCLPEEAGIGALALDRVPGELEVAVGRHAVALQRHAAAEIIEVGDIDVMIAGFHLAEGEACLQVHRQRDGIDLSVFLGVENRRFDLFTVGNRIVDGIAGAAVEVDGLNDRLRIIAGRDHHRETERIEAVRLTDRALVLDLYDDRFAGADIGDLVGEDVRALLLEQCRLLALGLRLFVDLLGFLARLYLALDEAVADLHLQRIDRRILGQGEDIGAFDPALAGVLEALGHAGAHDRAVDVDRHVRRRPRRLDEVAGFLRREEQGARADIVGANITCHLLRLGVGSFGRGLGHQADDHQDAGGERCDRQIHAPARFVLPGFQ